METVDGVQTESTSKSLPLATLRASASSLQLQPTAPLCRRRNSDQLRLRIDAAPIAVPQHRRDSDLPCLSVAATLICCASASTRLQSTVLTFSHSTPVEALIHRFLHAAPPRQHRSDPCRCSSDPMRLHDTTDR
jgi:hypothetical protein